MWSSPVSYSAQDFAKIIRESLEDLKFIFLRDNTAKSYSRFVVMIPMMSGAHVFRYTVEYPSKFVIHLYDTYPGTKAGLMPFIEIGEVDESNQRDIQRLLKKVASKVDRPPWEFTASQRVMVGFLLPEFGQARKAWAKFGFDTSKKASKERKRRNKEKASTSEQKDDPNDAKETNDPPTNGGGE